MTDTTNPAAEAEALKAKTPPPMPAGSITPDPLKPATTLGTKPVTNVASIEAAITSVTAAQKSIAGCGNVTSNTALASSSCVKALEWLNKELVAAQAAAPKA
jgi:hypothetical protein